MAGLIHNSIYRDWSGVRHVVRFSLLSFTMAPSLLELFHATPSISCSEAIAIASLVLGLICVVSYLRWRRRVASYPPGPPPDPILGNARQLVRIDNQERAFADWERTYGQLPGSATPFHLLSFCLGKRRHQLPQRFQQVDFDPQLLLGCKGPFGEEGCDLFQSPNFGHVV